MSYVFVYGTLMKGFDNHFVLEPYIVSVRSASILGKICHLPDGYPMLFQGNGVVHGELVELKNEQQALVELDELEEYYGQDNTANYYERKRKTVKDNCGCEYKAWVYLCPQGREEAMYARGIALHCGDWGQFMLNRNKK